MRRLAVPVLLATVCVSVAASAVVALPASKPTIALPPVVAPVALTPTQLQSMLAQLRANAVTDAAKNGGPPPAPRTAAASVWQSPVVLSPATPVDAGTGSYILFQNPTLVSPKYGPGPMPYPVGFFHSMNDFPQDYTNHTWTLLGAEQEGVEIVLNQLTANSLYAMDCMISTQAMSVGMVFYTNDHRTMSVTNGHVVTAFMAQSAGGLKLGVGAVGCPNAIGVCPMWTFHSCTFTAI